MEYSIIEETWFSYYTLCCEYFEKNGNLLVPNKFEIDGVKLGYWIYRQRKKYKENKLCKEKIQKLESLGMVWDSYESNWLDMYNLAKQYYFEYGDLNIPARYVIQDKDLGGWVSTQRKGYFNHGKHRLSEKRKKLLEDIGMVWDVNLINWFDYYQEAKIFYEKFHHLYIPIKYKTDSNINLGKWLSSQRQMYRKAIKENTLSLIQDKVELLEDIGIDWNINKQKNTSFGEQVLYYYLSQCFNDIENRYDALGFEIDIYIDSLNLGIEYDGYIGHKDVNRDKVKIKKCKENGITLLNIRDKRCPLLTGETICTISDEVEDLEFALSFIIDYIFKKYNFHINLDIDILRDYQHIMDMYLLVSSYSWEKYFDEAEIYYNTYGNLRIPAKYVSNNLNLGYWIRRQREGYKLKHGNRLNRNQIERLENIGMIWDVNEFDWWEKINLVEKSIEKGIKNISQRYKIEGRNIGYWWHNQYKKYQENILEEKKMEKIRGILVCLNS